MIRRPHSATFVALVLALALLVPASARRSDPLIQIEDVYVELIENGWAIGSSLMRYELRQEGGVTRVVAVRDVLGDRDWHRAESPDSVVMIDGQRVEIGSAATGLMDVNASEWWGGVRLDLRYRHHQ